MAHNKNTPLQANTRQSVLVVVQQLLGVKYTQKGERKDFRRDIEEGRKGRKEEVNKEGAKKKGQK